MALQEFILQKDFIGSLFVILLLTMGELSDIVNARDEKVSVKNRKDIKGDFVNTRYVNIFIRNSHGQFWVPWRANDLKRWPSSPDFAVGGAVMAGETYGAAALREAEEEIGLRLTEGDLKEIAYLSPYKYPVASFSKTYELICSEVPFIAGEYKLAQWMELPDLIALLAVNEVAVKTDLLPILRLCYGNLRDMDRTLFRPDVLNK